MKLTRKQAIAEHRKMWNWIADEHEKGNVVKKSDYLQSHGFDPREFSNSSFLCEYVNQYGLNCRSCPIQWCYEHCSISEYEQFLQGDYKERAYWARKIANLPERED